ncbi:MAG: DNA topoisomerase I [Desulfurococcales archaeon]|nr:DNA topoisomerase I [Desulfurococcales archaeon]
MGRSGSCRPGRGYTVIVAEKPKAAEKIAWALGRPVKCRLYGVPYWVLRVNGSSIVVAPSAGHLYGTYTSQRGFPVYTYYWAPIWEHDRSAGYLKKFYLMLASILPKAGVYINACDYDTEGSLIGYMIIERLGDVRRAYRMKFSSLGREELRRSYRNLQPLDMEMVEAGRTRHELDWLWGINLSRALMYALSRFSGARVSLSAGRVQSPTLVEAKNRWVERSLHVPKPSFTLEIILDKDGAKFKATPLGWKPKTRLEAVEHARRIRKLGRMKVKAVRGSRATMNPLPAFNLGDLQAEASRLYGYSPAKTQSLAEDLYLEGLISYPRTNSQKLPPAIGYNRILNSLRMGPYSGLVSRLLAETRGVLKPVQGRKDDPAHPAIHPTGEAPKGLDRDHGRIYDLVVRRFLAAFAGKAVIAKTSVVLVDDDGYQYSASGVGIVVEGWLHYYPYAKPRGDQLPSLSPGEYVEVSAAKANTIWSKPQASLSKIELLKWMEKVNIGTEATRSRIIETLFKRGYLKNSPEVQVTELGLTVAAIIEELFPQLSSPSLTRYFEEKLEEVRTGRTTREKVIREAIATIDELLNVYRERLDNVGSSLSQALGLSRPRVKCMVCDREGRECNGYVLCKYHCMALTRLRRELAGIADAMGKSEQELLKWISSTRYAGTWVRDVARLLREKPTPYRGS